MALTLGIADESGTLKEGEIYCQYQESEETEAVVVKGEVLVCRAPACGFVSGLVDDSTPGRRAKGSSSRCPPAEAPEKRDRFQHPGNTRSTKYVSLQIFWADDQAGRR
jgi:hypothetical protein